jgi:hypothetical protein
MNANLDRISPFPLYVSTRALTRILGAFFILAAAVSWAAAGYDLGEVRTFAQIQKGASLEPAQTIAHEKAGGLLRILQIVSAALVATAFLPWFYQVRCNLRAFGLRRLRFGREWTYLGFLVPGLNFFRPHQVMSEVWRGSHSEGTEPVAWQHLSTPPLLTGWWCALVAWISIELLASLLLHLATGITRIQLAHCLSLGADTCAALSASLGYLMVTRVQNAQEMKAKDFGENEASAPMFQGHVTA